MEELLSSQLFSVVIGACLTLIASLIISRRTYANSLDEEIAKERISAYKKVCISVSQLNHSLSPQNCPTIPNECYLGYIRTPENEYHMSYCFPAVFINFQTFHEFKANFSILLNDNRILLDQSVMNKLSFLDSYLSEIWHLANAKDDEYLHMLGFALSNEIDHMCRSIEDDIQMFFYAKKRSTQKSNFSNTYKYEYERRKKTDLFTIFTKNNNIEQFGDFPLCLNCKFYKKCPLNPVSNDTDSANCMVADIDKVTFHVEI